jgi:hypothetical protein
MIFREDFTIKTDEKGKVKKKDIEKLYGEFCKNYVNQIKDKLNFDCKFIEVLKKVDDDKKESQLKTKTNAITLRKNVSEIQKVVKKMIRFEMRMIKPTNRTRKIRDKIPKVSRPPQNKEKTKKKRAERKAKEDDK